MLASTHAFERWARSRRGKISQVVANDVSGGQRSVTCLPRGCVCACGTISPHSILLLAKSPPPPPPVRNDQSAFWFSHLFPTTLMLILMEILRVVFCCCVCACVRLAAGAAGRVDSLDRRGAGPTGRHRPVQRNRLNTRTRPLVGTPRAT